MSEWISFKETLPKVEYEKKKPFVRVLVYSPKRGILLGSMHFIFKMKKGKMFCTGFSLNLLSREYDEEDEMICDATHWMPLPQPPEEDK